MTNLPRFTPLGFWTPVGSFRTLDEQDWRRALYDLEAEYKATGRTKKQLAADLAVSQRSLRRYTAYVSGRGSAKPKKKTVQSILGLHNTEIGSDNIDMASIEGEYFDRTDYMMNPEGVLARLRAIVETTNLWMAFADAQPYRERYQLIWEGDVIKRDMRDYDQQFVSEAHFVKDTTLDDFLQAAFDLLGTILGGERESMMGFLLKIWEVRLYAKKTRGLNEKEKAILEDARKRHALYKTTKAKGMKNHFSSDNRMLDRTMRGA